MSQFIKFYFTSSMLNMFRTLTGGCGFSIVPPHWLCVLVSMWLVGVVSIWQAEADASACNMDTTPTSHTETPTHIATRTHNQCGDTIEKSQAPDD